MRIDTSYINRAYQSILSTLINCQFITEIVIGYGIIYRFCFRIFLIKFSYNLRLDGFTVKISYCVNRDPSEHG